MTLLMTPLQQRWYDFFSLADTDQDGLLKKHVVGVIAPGDVIAPVMLAEAATYFTSAQISTLQNIGYNALVIIIEAYGGPSCTQVNFTQFWGVIQSLLLSSSTPPSWCTQSLTALFAVIDLDGDGIVTQQQFVEVITAVISAITADAARAAFAITGTLSLDLSGFLAAVWNWVTALLAIPQDLLLSLACAQYL